MNVWLRNDLGNHGTPELAVAPVRSHMAEQVYEVSRGVVTTLTKTVIAVFTRLGLCCHELVRGSRGYAMAAL